jgi:single-strand DNA-binding protein
MARGLNNVYLVGTLTQAPELRYTPGGLAILELNVAGNDQVVGSDGQERELAWYHRTSVLGKQAEYLADQLQQGSPVFIDGRLNYRAWDDANGQRRSALDVTAIRVDILTHGPRKGETTVTDVKGQERLKNALNQVVIIGNLIKDAQLRYTPGGDAVASFVVAVNEQYRDRGGQDQERVHFVEVNAWRDLGEACGELVKGDPVLVSGRLVNDSWTDKDGNRQFKTKIESSRIEFLTRGPGGGGAGARPNKPETASSENRQDDRASQRLDIDEEFPPEEDLPF